MAYTLPELGYEHNALEPYFDAQTMEIHHSKHHQTYITKLNDALKNAEGYEAPEDIYDLIADLPAVPENIRTAVRNNAGGHANHTFFWKILSRRGPSIPQGSLNEAINAKFEHFEAFKEKFEAAGVGRFGSGWVWLCVKSDKDICICSTPNQDSPLMQGVVECPGTPIIGLDVWEHAYYLKYQNRRPDYIKAFWEVVNWEQAEENYQNAIGG